MKNDGWRKDEAYLLKIIQMWSKPLGHTIDPFICKDMKRM